MLISDWIKRNRESRNNKFNQKLRKEIIFRNTPTIIANNCIGGIIYHNLGLEFKSPTINLYLENEDFLLFVLHLREFLNGELIEVTCDTKNFPVGQITCEYGAIKIYFQHYETFHQAKAKWEQRTKRIDWDNIVVIMEEGIIASDKLVEKFETIPYVMKVLISNGNAGHIDVKNGYPMYIYDKKYHPGKILDFGRFKISNKRYLDDFDYVSFLNTGKIQQRN